MAQVLGVDHRYFVLPTFALSAGIAIYSTYKWRTLKRSLDEGNVYETEKSLQEYLVFHYGSKSEVLQWDLGPKDSLEFPKRCADLCMKYYDAKSGLPSRALDIGCAVGRHSFELTRQFEEVIGIDYSHRFIDTCNELKQAGKKSYQILLEGDLYQDVEAVVEESLDRSRAVFHQGDACNLPSDLGQFGCVLAANLICRLNTPTKFLTGLAKLVAPGGIAVITSPYTFLREYTPRKNWIGGYKTDDGATFTGFDGLKAILGEDFDLIAEENMPFFIRETRRKNQWTVAHATVWKRRN